MVLKPLITSQPVQLAAGYKLFPRPANSKAFKFQIFLIFWPQLNYFPVFKKLLPAAWRTASRCSAGPSHQGELGLQNEVGHPATSVTTNLTFPSSLQNARSRYCWDERPQTHSRADPLCIKTDPPSHHEQTPSRLHFLAKISAEQATNRISLEPNALLKQTAKELS